MSEGRHRPGRAGDEGTLAPGRGGSPASLTGLDLRLALPAGLAWAALCLALPLPAPAIAACGGVCVGGAGLAYARRWTGRRSSWLSTALLLTGLLLLIGGGHVAVRAAGGLGDLAGQRAVVTLEGRLATDPRLLPAGPERRRDTVLVKLDATRVVGRGQEVALSSPVLVLGSRDWLERRWWESVRVTGRLSSADPGQDVVAVLVPSAAPEILAGPGPVADVAEHVRSRLRAACADIPPDAQGLVPGLVIGDTSMAPAVLTDDMRATGLTHLSAVSGSNVAIVLSAALALARALALPRRARPALAGVLLVGFVVLARPEPSVVRAAVMGGVALIGLQGSRRGAGLPALGAAVLVVLSLDPWLSRSYGFALSVLATAGLLLFARPWGAAIAARLPGRMTLLGEAIAIPLAAQVVCAPVIVLLSGTITVVGVLANLLAAPLVAPATILGVSGALVSAVHGGAGALLVALAALPALGIGQIAHRCAVLPLGQAPWIGGTAGALLLAALTAVGLACAPRVGWAAARRPGAAIACVALLAAAVLPGPRGPWPHADWRFVVCDVGQGDGLVLRTGAQTAVLIDTGPRPEPIIGCLRRLGVQRLDAVLLTHLHDDHCGGIEGVLAQFPVREVFQNAVDDPPADARRVSAALSAHGLVAGRLSGGDALRWGEVSALVRTPLGRIDAGSVPNNNSLTLDVRTGAMRLLLLADIEREAGAQLRRELERDGDAGPVDVVKVAHHGSANVDRDLMERVHAQAFVISVGADNDFGHPAPSLLGTLAATGVPVYRTDRDGDVLVCLEAGRPSLVRAKRTLRRPRGGRARRRGGRRSRAGPRWWPPPPAPVEDRGWSPP